MATFYRILLDNGYLHGSCMQTTKDKIKALMCLTLAEDRQKLVGGVIESVEIQTKPCKVSQMTFGRGDTYNHEIVDGVILHETKKSIWTCPIDNAGNPKLSYTTKHKKCNEGTIDYNTREGYKLI